MAEYDGIFDAVVGVAQGGAQFFKATCKHNTGSGSVSDGESGTWADVDDSSGAISFFAGVAEGDAVYFGAKEQFFSMKVEFTGGGDMGAAMPPWQFWDGSQWSPVPVMFSSAGGEHHKEGGPGGGGGPETMRMGDMASWATKALDGETLYWVRFILPEAITTSPSGFIPTVSTAKSFTNEEGVTEFFGDARPVFTFDLESDGSSGLASKTLALSFGISLEAAESTFPDAASNSKVFFARCPVGLDATVPLSIDINFVSATATSGNVEWDVVATLVPNDGGTLGSLQEYSDSVVQPIGAADTMYMATLDLQVDGLFPGALLVLKVTRDAQAGNAEDTYADDVHLAFVECRGTKWKV